MRPVIVIGAARSGTNLMRDLLTTFPGFGTWPCDEINPIWKYGNIGFPHDELPEERATPTVARFIRSRFDRLRSGSGVERVVEKTCANSLRVEFVDRVLPEARYVFLIRDGRDVMVSAMKRWGAPPDLAYTLKKARFVPLPSVPVYAARWFRNRLRQLTSEDGRVGTWGPRFEGIDGYLETHGLAATCARQWARSVQRSVDAFDRMSQERYHRIRYEELVASPRNVIRDLASFLELSATTQSLNAAEDMIQRGSVGKGRKTLSQDDFCEILPHFDGWLERVGYA